MTRLGFTGTREGLTERQAEVLAFVVAAAGPDEAHHGDCVGADEAFHRIVRQNVPEARIVIHPPNMGGLRAECEGDETRVQLPYLERNANIVAETDRLVACPKEPTEAARSGTWATVRLARKQGRRVMVILPDGSIQGLAATTPPRSEA